VAYLLAYGCVPDLDHLSADYGKPTGGVGGLGTGGLMGEGGEVSQGGALGGAPPVGKGGRTGAGGRVNSQGGRPNPEDGGAGGFGGVSGGAGGEPGSGGIAGAGGTNPGTAGEGPLGESGAGGYFGGPCPSSTLVGWASVAGLNFDPATDVPAATDVDVSTAEDLIQYAGSPDPYVIHVFGALTVPALDVKSNKTLVGATSDAAIIGGIRILGTGIDPTAMVSNVTIKNLLINALTSDTSTNPDDDDGITIAYAHHVWVDHVDVLDAPGDGIDVTNGSDFVTISWTKFRFEQAVRHVATRIGNSDANEAEDSGRLKVTMHHNWWTNKVDQRMPRVRFGDVHVFNNLFSHTDPNVIINTYCVAAAFKSRLLVENNYFDQVQNPHVFFSFVNNMASYTEPTAQMVAAGNTYIGRSDDDAGKLSGQGDAFVPPYPVTLEPATLTFKNEIRYCAGPERPE